MMKSIYMCNAYLIPLADHKLNEMTGPCFTEQWTSWKSRSPQQTAALAISYELERLLGHEKARKAQLSTDEMITIKKNLQTQKVDASDDLVRRHIVILLRFQTGCCICYPFAFEDD